ncbi:MAG: DoxX-like family protein [Burkholderiales bacterium]|nr:DoxX-like family protein [Burkholderiales bacterium]
MRNRNFDESGRDRSLAMLYWVMRLGMAFIWLWTAVVSWFAWPHAESLEWLRRLGLTSGTEFAFAAACLVDLLLGIASCAFASRRLWQLQFALVVFYSLAVAVALPEFLVHPFGPIAKNIAVLACLAWLATMEKRA